MLELEEEHVKAQCADIIALKPDLVITEKGVSDLAQHFLSKANISVIRRVRKSDNNRISRASGATIANRTEELKEEDVGTGVGLFEVKKVGRYSQLCSLYNQFLRRINSNALSSNILILQ